MLKKPHRQMFLDIYPSPEKYYKENILELLGDYVRNFQKLANEKGLPVHTLLKVGGPLINNQLIDIWKDVIHPEKRTAEKIHKYYEGMALILYKQFVEKTGKTDIRSFKRFLNERIPIIPDEAMTKNLKALEHGIPIKLQRIFVETEKIPVRSWKLSAFTDPVVLSARKYMKRLEEEIVWRKQAIERIEKELKKLKENRKLMKIIMEKNWLSKDFNSLSKMRPRNTLEKEALTLARRIKEEERLLHTMKNILNSQKNKLTEYKRYIQSFQAEYKEKRVKRRKPFIDIQHELYKARRKISPLTTLHPFRRKR